MSAAPTTPSIAVPLPSLAADRQQLATALDGLDQQQLTAWMRGLGRRELIALFDLAKGSHLEPDDLVRADGQVAICEGKNALPLFTQFQKRFVRVGDEVVGYNHNPAFATFFVGPGHFVLEPSSNVEGEAWVNYQRLAEQRHPEVPELVDNDRLLSLPAPFARWAYGDMIDILRRVSAQLVVGRSVKPSGRWGLNAGQYFALVIPRSQ